MIIMALECSAVSASVALVEEDRLLAESFISVRLTHSQTLMPMAESLLRSACLMLDQVDGFPPFPAAPAPSPVCASAWRRSKAWRRHWGGPARAYPLWRQWHGRPRPCQQSVDAAGRFVLCPVMDARCSQVYNALFDLPLGVEGGSPPSG